MSVYVDSLADRGWRLGPNCHMLADSVEELHAMAARIGLRREWFQPESSPHYDLTAARRRMALNAGAVPIGRMELVALIRSLRQQQRGGTP